MPNMVLHDFDMSTFIRLHVVSSITCQQHVTFIFDPTLSHPNFLNTSSDVLHQHQVMLIYISFSPILATMTEQSLQSMFHHVFVTQRFIQNLTLAEELLMDVSDHLEEHEIGHENVLFQIRTNLRQFRTNLDFLLAIQLLDVCRAIEAYVRTNGRLPQMDLEFT